MTPREYKLLQEAAAKKREFERNHVHAWIAWHIASLQRQKKLPNIKTLYAKQTTKPRQSWRQQLQLMTDWAAKHNMLEAKKQKLKEITDGR